MIRKWIKASCLMVVLTGSAQAAQETYVVGSGGTPSVQR